MVSCELCGKEGNLIKTLIEGVAFNVCDGCKSHGKVVEFKRQEIKNKEIFKRQEIIEQVVSNYSEIIKKCREKSGLTQKDLAVKLSEKENMISKLENGEMKPTLDLARKIGKFFNVKLVAVEKFDEFANKPNASTMLTIGDFIKE